MNESPPSRRRSAVVQEEPPPESLPPHSLQAEEGVLACIILAPLESIALCVERFKPGGDVFFILKHRTIYEALVRLWDKDKAIDLITLRQQLADNQQLEEMGGIGYLSTLPDRVPSAANLEHYIQIVLQKFILRKVIAVCVDIKARAYAEPEQVEELMAVAATAMQNITEATLAGSTVKPASVLVEAANETIDRLTRKDGHAIGITTGFIDLDKMCWGLHPADMFVIAGRPGTGKTSAGMNIAEHVAVNLHLPVGVFSLEMSDESLMLRMICSRSKVSMRNLRDGFCTERDFERLKVAGVCLHKAPIFVDDSSGLSILQLRAKARRMCQTYGIKLFVVDYLQLLHSTLRRNENRQQEVSDISHGLKSLAKELRLPVLVLCQLNRDVEKRGLNAKPKMSDLRESGSIEADADVVAMLYRKDPEKEDGPPEDTVLMNLLIAKSRNGPTGNVELVFLKSLTRFENAGRITGRQASYPYADL